MKVAPEELAKGEVSEFMHVRATRTSGINKRVPHLCSTCWGGGGGGIFTCVQYFQYQPCVSLS